MVGEDLGRYIDISRTTRNKFNLTEAWLKIEIEEVSRCVKKQRDEAVGSPNEAALQAGHGANRSEAVVHSV